ncbi:MAG: hypothetical protein HZA37_01285, partial [Parcubacteria group bacterium]|nr:hypothetical protein [Parcubacteria group bacterium]
MILKEAGETKEIEIKDATFTIKCLDAKTYRRLTSRLSFKNTILKSISNGLGAEELKNLMKSDPAEYQEADEKAYEALVDFIRHGVSGHTGIQKSDGSDVPFLADDDGLVSQETIEVYDQLRITFVLASEVISFNTLSDED